MTTPLTGAVVGCGRMGAFTSEGVLRHAPGCWHPLNHATAMTAHPQVRLAALCDANPEQLARAAKAHGVSDTFADFGTMLAETKPDILAIATRTLGRAEIIEKAISSGVRALHAEKPLCNSVAELTALRSALGNIPITFGTIRRHFAIFKQAKEIVDSGRFGALQEIRVNLGAGSLYWTHPHAIDFVLFAAGNRQVKGVQAHLDNVVAETSTTIINDPILVSATIYFEDGVVGRIGRALGTDFVFSCHEGEVAVKADGDRTEITSMRPREGYPSVEMLPRQQNIPEGTLAALSQLVSCLDGDESALGQNAIVRQDMLLGQQIAFAFVQSHFEASRIVAVSDIDPALVVYAQTGGRYA